MAQTENREEATHEIVVAGTGEGFGMMFTDEAEAEERCEDFNVQTSAAGDRLTYRVEPVR